MRFDVQQDCRLTRASGGRPVHILASVQAPFADRKEKRTPVNLSFVIDRSGSMAGEKLEYAKEAVLQALRSLHPEDRFSVVAYDDVIDVLVESCIASPENRAGAEQQVRALDPRSMTDLFGGWMTGSEQIAVHLGDADVGRCLLLTDGLANRGETRHDEIVRHVGALRERRVSTTTFGVGHDFDESLLRRMAEAGGGNFYFIERHAQIPDVMASEVGETLEVVAREAVLVVQAPPDVELRSLNDYRTHRDGGTWRFELGTLVSGQLVDPLLAADVPGSVEGEPVQLTLRLEDRDGAFDVGERRVTFTAASDEAFGSQTREPAVTREVAEQRTSRASRKALEYNRAGEYGRCRQLLHSTAQSLLRYAQGDPEVIRHVHLLEERAEKYGRRMDANTRKLMHYREHLLSEKRGGFGAVKRAAVFNRVQRGVVLLPSTPEVGEPCLRAVSALEPHAGRLLSEVSLAHRFTEQVQSLPIKGKILFPREEELLVQSASYSYPLASVRVVVTPLGFRDNWFSHWDERTRTAVISTYAFDQMADVAVEAFLAYETIFYGLIQHAPNVHPLTLVHQETRGCVFDFCGLKTDIEIKLQTMDICAPCRERLEKLGIRPADLSALCDVVRGMARHPGVAGRST